jgi:hypothetical protein
MHQPPRLGSHRAIRIRVYDGTHEVLHRYRLLRMLDVESPMLPSMLPALLVEAAQLATVLENEPMTRARIELWCELSNTKLHDYRGGTLL